MALLPDQFGAENRRRAHFLRGVRPAEMAGLEVGALNRPTVSRADGRILYADFTSTERLRELYERVPSVDVNTIVDVDVVWNDGVPLQSLIGDQRLDYVLASHVIEHIPNVLSWLEQIAECLNGDGVLSLVVPDKRFTFDRDRALSTLGEIVGAYVEGSKRPTPSQIFNHVGQHVLVDPEEAWKNPTAQGDFKRVHTYAEAFQITQNVFNAGQYFDAHCWVVTPRSMLDLFEGLAHLGRLPFEICAFTDSQSGEIDFFMTLRKLDPTLSPAARLDRQLAAIDEARAKIVVG
jgi:hypothetical protein